MTAPAPPRPDDTYRRECVRLLDAIAAATAAVSGMPESNVTAQWIRFRAECYRHLAAITGDPITAEMSTGAAEVDEATVARIEQEQSCR